MKAHCKGYSYVMTRKGTTTATAAAATMAATLDAIGRVASCLAYPEPRLDHVAVAGRELVAGAVPDDGHALRRWHQQNQQGG